MILGILRETKKGENRVICTPKEVETITSAGHTVYAQRGCGERDRQKDPMLLVPSNTQDIIAASKAPCKS